MNRRITNNLKILFIFALRLSLGGGIGRRARLKLVFFGVWVRFPPKVLTLQKFLKGFLMSQKIGTDPCSKTLHKLTLIK